jgi:hypothetical protein
MEIGLKQGLSASDELIPGGSLKVMYDILLQRMRCSFVI